MSEDPTKIPCPSCGSGRYVSVSLDGAWTRRAQCVPCGRIHAYLGPGTEQVWLTQRRATDRSRDE